MTYHYFKPHLGGVEEVIHMLAKGLVEKNHDVTIITSNIGENDIRPENEVIDGINVIRCKAAPFIFRAIRLKGFKEKLEHVNPDIFHAHHPIPGVSDTTIFYAQKNLIPSVLTYHADSQEDTFLSKIAARVYYRLIGNRAVEAADAVVTHTQSYAETSPVLKNFLDKIIINPLGVDVKRFNPDVKDNGIREKYKLKDKFVILALGRLVPYKGYKYLINAMKYLDDDYVLILGGKGILRDSLMKLANDLKLKNRVIFAGFIPETQKTSYYAACDVFCAPSISRGEAFGVSILEAIACGKPVVATNIPGVREIASIGGRITLPRNPMRLAETIKKMREDPINKNKLYQTVKDRFSWEKIVGKYISIYKELLG
jgi:glycosyltransferase involved in cell wall biosynthesis